MIIGLLSLAALLVLVAGRATASRGREIVDRKRENFILCLLIWSFEDLDLSLGEVWMMGSWWEGGIYRVLDVISYAECMKSRGEMYVYYIGINASTYMHAKQ